MGKFRPKRDKKIFNLMTALDKDFIVLKGEPNNFEGKIITVVNGYINSNDEIIVETACGKKINSKYLEYKKREKK